ncbi:transcriptional regulator LsrR [Deinococcus rubellus]|uniref:sugar-binding domain-containing protein n=1 Tax=Deinococcus rubellus TaxID=1889240 RepID=UPI0031EA711C
MKSPEPVTSSPELDDEETLSRAAWYYYHDGLTQADIGERLGLPRLKVSRLLERARRLGLIQVKINSSLSSCLALEHELTQQFHLHAAVVIPPLDAANLNDRLGQAAAQYLMQVLRDSEMLAVGWGDTVTRALQRLAYTFASRNISSISLTGGVSGYLQGLGLPQLSAQNIHLIPAPILASSPELARAFKEEPRIAELLAMTQLAQVALVGIGATDEQATLVKSGYVSASELTLFRRMGAVGDVLGHFYDVEGKMLDISLHQQIIGISLSQLGTIPIRIGASGGPPKVAAILGALAGGHINVLITDEETATQLLRNPA